MQITYTKKSFFARSIRNKLVLILISISFIPLATVGGMAMLQLYAAKNAASEITKNYLPSIINLNNAELALMNIVEAQKNHIIAPDDDTMRTLEKNIETRQAIMNDALTGFEKTLDVGKETEAFEKFSKVLADFLRLNAQVILFSQTNDDDKAQALSVGEANDVFQEAFGLMKIMLETNIVGSENAKIAVDTAFQTGSVLILVMSILSVVIVIIIAMLIGNSIAKPILVITEAARSLATDDATLTRIDTTKLAKIIVREDEIGDIGRAYNTLVNYFKALSEDFIQVSKGLAAGNLNITPKAEYKGDFIKVKDALEASLTNLKLVINDIVQVSQGLAIGDLQVIPKAKYNGDFAQIKDGLDTTLFYLGEVIRDIVQVSQGLAEGNVVTTKTEYLGDFTKIKNALEVAVTKLTDATNQNKVQDWLKSGQAKLNEQIAGEQELFSMSKKTISFLTTYIEAEIGLFYILKEEDNQQYLQLIASYAYLQENKITNKTKITEGLAGQAVLEQKIIRRTQTPEECPAIVSSGLSRSLPQHVILLPFLYENEVKGVIEIGSTTVITDIQHSFLEQIMPNIGIAVNTANSRSKMQKLLKQSQQQSEELQSQQEELRQTNNELQNQSEELQTQQEELRQSNEILGERTKDLERQKLAVQNKNQALEISKIEMEKTKEAIVLKAKELELASKYKSEFLANMSHELRTPLNSLLILSQLLTENTSGNLDAKQVEYAKTINSAGNDLLTLINDILDLSKVEAGKVEVQWENVSLSKLLTSIEQKFSPIANDKKVTFNLTIANDIPDILVTDSQRIKQIINNLLSNALKFTSEGEVKLIVQYPTELPANIEELGLNKAIAISVTDTGIGIPKDKQQSIFEAFQQADGSTSRRYGGTGLGLSISRQLSRLLGGELTLISETNKGSTFTLYLPESSRTPSQSLVEQSLLTEEYELSKEVLLVDDRNDLSVTDITILIIEDDRKFSKIIIELAQSKGFKYLLAEDGLTGLNLAEEYKPDAIILDIGLPKLDGLTLMRKLKDNSSIRHIPVHFMSATDQVIDAKKMGAIGYLVKPINIEKLREAFHKIETFLIQTLKTVLIIADSQPNQQQIIDLIADEDLQIEVSISSNDACKKLLDKTYDCVILDMDLEQNLGGKALLEKMQQETGKPCKVPIIVYVNRDLTTEEKALLLRCSGEIPIKSASTPELLVDETTLFLHQIESNLSKDKRKMLHMVHDKQTILKHKKVLIVDDDERNIFALATILENRDAEVICGLNGKEGLEHLKQHDDIAIILMDIMMPEMDGYEAIRKIRKQKKYHDLPIIALTAKAMKDDKAKCIEAGANDYLAKPVDANKLISLMRVWLYQ